MPRNRIAVALAAAALVGGGAGAGIATLAHDGGAPSAATATTEANPAEGASTNVANGSLTVGQIASRSGKSVVEIDASSRAASSFPYGSSGSQSAEGTGFVYDSKGDIATNAHVVDGSSSLRVKFSDGSTYKATLVGEDLATDVAVVHVDAPDSKLTPLVLADSSRVSVGDGVVAIGNPFGLDGTVTSGIVSAVGRTITAPDNTTPISGAIQTDAAINHGNSGGPLFDLNGEVIGITSQIQSDGGGNEGVGFAIPSNLVKTIADELISSGKAQHALLGVTPVDVPGGGGVRISSVEGAAKAAGLKAGDVIVAVDGKAVDASSLRALIAADQPGDMLTLTIHRDGQTKTVKATLGSRS